MASPLFNVDSLSSGTINIFEIFSLLYTSIQITLQMVILCNRLLSEIIPKLKKYKPTRTQQNSNWVTK